MEKGRGGGEMGDLVDIDNKKKPPVQFFAHSGASEDLSDWQLLPDHLHGVGNLAAEFASWFDAQELARNAGLLHDLGKYCTEFFERLNGSSKRVDHATAGAKIAAEKWGQLGKLLAYCIAGHHAGLANGIDEGQQRSTLEQRLKLKHGQDIPLLDAIWQQEVKLSNQLAMPNFRPEKNQQGFQIAFLTRMIFSCLIDADRTDTSNYYLRIEGKSTDKNQYPTLQQLKDKLDTTLKAFESANKDQAAGSINQLRQHILEYSREQAKLPTGLFSLTVPTGGGKTYTSMAFALEHAITHQLRRVIYVIPFTSIIEQNAKVFRDAFGVLSEAVIEHHSAFDANNLPNKNARDTLKQAMESWDAPIIVTTAVQFFESLFSDLPSQCRKLHNIAGSVIILDEAQTLPLKLLRPVMAAIDELARNYKCSVVLCTATQPALKKTDDFHNGFENVREIAPEPKVLFEKLKRTEVKSIGIQVDGDLVRQLIAREQVLVIVNNRRHARALFEAIKDQAGATHLTTLMCAKHRSQVLEKVRADLKHGHPCRLISTSLIEAGVDVDFPCVLRAEAGLDSIAQAAGRCNREGKRPLETSEVLVFQSPEWKAPPELDQLAGNMREVVRNYAGDVLTPEALTMYFKSVYWSQGAALDSKKLLDAHRNHAAQFSFPFQNIARDFCMIEAHLKPVIIEFDEEATQLVEALKHAENVGGIARQLQRYLVQIPQKGFEALLSNKVIEAIAPENLGDQFWRLINKDLYSNEAGLSWENPTYIKAENTVLS
jgi:CRISPR-associated endonuclease/helicase Cas3